jgi:hypothetical protein
LCFADSGNPTVKSLGLQPFHCWDRGFKSC